MIILEIFLNPLRKNEGVYDCTAIKKFDLLYFCRNAIHDFVTYTPKVFEISPAVLRKHHDFFQLYAEALKVSPAVL